MWCAVFHEENKELLQRLPPPEVAAEYYRGTDLYMFAAFQVSSKEQDLRQYPECNNLYDVFVNIKDDENEHTKTMVACQVRPHCCRVIGVVAVETYVASAV